MQKPRTKTHQEIIRDKEFGKRLTAAADDHPNVPPHAHGRLQWFVDAFAKKNVDLTIQTASRWLDGGFRPRPDKIRILAELLGIDESWLALGVEGAVTVSDLKQMRAASSGAAMVVAGYIRMRGGSVAFPEPDDPRAEQIDMYVIAAGRQRQVKVALAEGGSSDLVFRLPNASTGAVVVGAMSIDPVTLEFFQVIPEAIGMGTRRGDHLELKAERRSGAVFVKNLRLPKVLDFISLFD